MKFYNLCDNSFETDFGYTVNGRLSGAALITILTVNYFKDRQEYRALKYNGALVDKI